MRPRLGWCFVCVLLGCGPTIDLGDGDGDGNTGADEDGSLPPLTSTTAPGTSTSGPSPTSTTLADDGNDDFDDGPFGIDCGAALPGSSHHCIGPGPDTCDLAAQNCLDANDRCVPWSYDGVPGWDDAWCIPVRPDPAGLGQPCEIVGSPWSGDDTCDRGLFCVAGEASPNEGVCWALCSAILDGEPICENGGSCTWLWNGLVPVCVDACDPLQPECAMGRCDAGRDPFACLPGVGEGAAVGEPCAQPGDCVSGAACVDAAHVTGCADVSCCTSVCDLLAPDPDAVCPSGRSCQPWFPAGAPVGLEHVGLCSTG